MLLSKYQLLFNFLGLCIITYGMVNALLYYFKRDLKYLKKTAYAQTFYLLEIFNIFIGATRSTYPPTIFQISSRLYIVWIVAYLHKINNVYLLAMFFVWNFSDLIRYLFYIFRGKLLKMLRYNAFILLYPIGIGLEVYHTNCVYLLYKDTLSYFFAGTMICYLPLFPFLYYHMIKQRKRSTKIFEMNKKRK